MAKHMSASRRASEILSAWTSGDGPRLNAELERALPFRATRDSLESERREVLASVAAHALTRGIATPPDLTAACRSLLRNLASLSTPFSSSGGRLLRSWD